MKVISTAHFSNSGRRTVLFIGNNLGVLKQIAFALQHRGHSVVWAESGQAALRVAESDAPALIISEIELPEHSGFEICRMIKASFFCETPVVLVGRSGDEGRDSPRAFTAGADDYFVSFTDWQFVMSKLEWLLQRRRFGRVGFNTGGSGGQLQLVH